jgi:hypothetical protein
VGTVQIPVESIQAGGMTMFSRLKNVLLAFQIRKNCQASAQNLLMYMFINGTMKMAAVIIKEYQCYQLHTKLYLIFFSQGHLPM